VIATREASKNVPARSDHARRRAATTPRRLQRFLVFIGAATVVVYVIGTLTMLTAQRAVSNVHRQSVPAIVGSQRIHATLADADRAEANAFLAGATEAASPHHQYELDIAAAIRELNQAVEQEGASSAAGRQIQDISVAVNQYTSLVDAARANNEQGYPVGAAYLRLASLMMHRPNDGILAKVDRLSALEARDLDSTNTVLAVSGGLLVAYVLAAIVLFILLART
jgi:hypothetical protein